MAVQPGLCRTLSETPKTGFLVTRYILYSRIGLNIATFPVITIVISITIPALLSIGMIKFKFDEDFADLLLPPQSRIFADRDWVEKHVPYEQRPIRLILKNDNVLSRESLIAVGRRNPFFFFERVLCRYIFNVSSLLICLSKFEKILFKLLRIERC